ncbi:MAG TPA: endonuclease Q family protein [Bacillota bacterium]|jgi:uncharacterized protein (TIGR00375 family)
MTDAVTDNMTGHRGASRPVLSPYYADFHIHVGCSADGRWVKVSSAADLTVENIAREAADRKGLDLVGVVDCQTGPVLKDLKDLVARGRLEPMKGGGLRFDGRLTILPFAELEVGCGRHDPAPGKPAGSAHFIAAVGTIEQAEALAGKLRGHVSNPDLSTQRLSLTPRELLDIVAGLDGQLIPAHAFTPYKSLYGNCADSLRQVFPEGTGGRVPAIELGLSADTAMADRLRELSGLTFLSDSDAHSLPKIAREYNLMDLAAPTYDEVIMALHRRDGRRVLANYGLDPRLGKYHRTHCDACELTVEELPPVHVCPRCGSRRVVLGVLDRLTEIADRERGESPPHRPPYHWQVPLEYLPGLGPKTMERLLAAFGTEMAVTHRTGPAELAEVVGERMAGTIIKARQGDLALTAGGGGRYGRVKAGE